MGQKLLKIFSHTMDILIKKFMERIVCKRGPLNLNLVLKNFISDGRLRDNYTLELIKPPVFLGAKF